MSSKSRQKQQNSKTLSASDGKEQVLSVITRLVLYYVDRLEQSQQQINNESESETSSSPQRAMESDDELSSSQEELLEDSHVGKRKKQVKDPNAPKRPRNAFLIYCQNQREQAREENQNNKEFQGVTRILSRKWKDLPENERKVYFEMYGKEKLRYEKEMSSYVGASSNNYIGPEDSQRNQNISIMTIEDVNINNVTNSVNEHSICYDDQANAEQQQISSKNAYNHYNCQEEKYQGGVDACATEPGANDIKDHLMMMTIKANGYEEDASNSSGNERMFDELAADIPYNRFDIIQQSSTDQSNNDAGNWLKKTAELIVEGGCNLEGYDRHDAHNLLSENED
ncbi:16187_t:CDS:2 [Entrophospora sp. SA101]|nr:16187_t:CDS:2 [Entrophospora sp. SA101]